MKIGFLGFGNMAQAMAGGFVRSGAVQPGDIGACARDRAKLRRNTEPQGFRAFDDAAAVAEFADLVVVAVKPYQVEAVLAPVRELLAKKIVVSVAAGVTFDDCERMLAPGTHHLSIVPNTPVSVCEGFIVCERRHSLSDGEWRQVEALFSKIGLVLPMDTALLGISSAVCGCGPAFVAMFIEALGDAAVKHGVARADAYRMARRNDDRGRRRTGAQGLPRRGDRRHRRYSEQKITRPAKSRVLGGGRWLRGACHPVLRPPA